MPPKRSSSGSNAELIDSLESWVNSHGFSEDKYMELFLNDLRAGKNLAKWADLDALDYLPFAQVNSHTLHLRFIEKLVLIRNVLVFVPVALTWLGIYQATRAFALYSNENGNSVANFLDFWQNGYGYLSPEWKIGTIAYTDALVIFLIIVLTLYTSIKGAKANHQREMMELGMESERALVAAKINMYLFDKKRITTATIGQALNASIDRLTRSSLAMEKATQILLKDAKQVQKLSSGKKTAGR
jgi:hypothetical protein